MNVFFILLLVIIILSFWGMKNKNEKSPIQKKYEEEIKSAITRKDTDKLDLTLRSLYLYNNRGSNVDTVNMHFDQVKAISPHYYE